MFPSGNVSRKVSNDIIFPDKEEFKHQVKILVPLD